MQSSKEVTEAKWLIKIKCLSNPLMSLIKFVSESASDLNGILQCQRTKFVSMAWLFYLEKLKATNKLPPDKSCIKLLISHTVLNKSEKFFSVLSAKWYITRCILSCDVTRLTNKCSTLSQNVHTIQFNFFLKQLQKISAQYAYSRIQWWNTLVHLLWRRLRTFMFITASFLLCGLKFGHLATVLVL